MQSVNKMNEEEQKVADMILSKLASRSNPQELGPALAAYHELMKAVQIRVHLENLQKSKSRQ